MSEDAAEMHLVFCGVLVLKVELTRDRPIAASVFDVRGFRLEWAYSGRFNNPFVPFLCAVTNERIVPLHAGRRTRDHKSHGITRPYLGAVMAEAGHIYGIPDGTFNGFVGSTNREVLSLPALQSIMGLFKLDDAVQEVLQNHYAQAAVGIMALQRFVWCTDPDISTNKWLAFVRSSGVQSDVPLTTAPLAFRLSAKDAKLVHKAVEWTSFYGLQHTLVVPAWSAHVLRVATTLEATCSLVENSERTWTGLVRMPLLELAQRLKEMRRVEVFGLPPVFGDYFKKKVKPYGPDSKGGLTCLVLLEEGLTPLQRAADPAKFFPECKVVVRSLNLTEYHLQPHMPIYSTVMVYPAHAIHAGNAHLVTMELKRCIGRAVLIGCPNIRPPFGAGSLFFDLLTPATKSVFVKLKHTVFESGMIPNASQPPEVQMALAALKTRADKLPRPPEGAERFQTTRSTEPWNADLVYVSPSMPKDVIYQAFWTAQDKLPLVCADGPAAPPNAELRNPARPNIFVVQPFKRKRSCAKRSVSPAGAAAKKHGSQTASNQDEEDKEKDSEGGEESGGGEESAGEAGGEDVLVDSDDDVPFFKLKPKAKSSAKAKAAPKVFMPDELSPSDMEDDEQ